jgi:hypothetical protein
VAWQLGLGRRDVCQPAASLVSVSLAAASSKQQAEAHSGTYERSAESHNYHWDVRQPAACLVRITLEMQTGNSKTGNSKQHE